MNAVLRSDAGRRLSALRIVHPFPTLMNVLVTGALALLASRGNVPPIRLAQLMLAMLCIQSCIGIVNDIVDLGPDAAAKPKKPLVSGAMPPRAARVLAVATLAGALLLSAGFGLGAWLLAVAGLACGLAYDLWLKRTWASALPYALALPLLPLWIWTALGRFHGELLLVIPMGALLGLALQLANSLPDYDSDAQAGTFGLAHRLGLPRAIALCWGLMALVLLLVGLSALALPYRLWALLPGLAAGVAALPGAIWIYTRASSWAALQTGWGLLVVGSAALALGWLAALP